MVDTNTTFNDFYTAVISRTGTQGEEAKDRVKNQETLLKNLGNLRESISGSQPGRGDVEHGGVPARLQCRGARYYHHGPYA